MNPREIFIPKTVDRERLAAGGPMSHMESADDDKHDSASLFTLFFLTLIPSPLCVSRRLLLRVHSVTQPFSLSLDVVG